MKENSIWRLNFLKRSFDVFLSLLGIILSLPLWVIIALFILFDDGWPIFYLQERVGKNGQHFKVIKFRTMIRDAERPEEPVQATENDPRVTRVGRFLRQTALDELPQLLNIFMGKMSFVGPRALRPQEKEVMGDKVVSLSQISGYHQRHQVLPGLTGLAQVYLPADAPRRKKFRYDLLYVQKRSFWLDIKLIILSFWITFRARWESREKKI
jgi:lipopolysaccharide/colanic/teichoic acid biosynthesis glycosyltransferase